MFCIKLFSTEGRSLLKFIERDFLSFWSVSEYSLLIRLHVLKNFFGILQQYTTVIKKKIRIILLISSSIILPYLSLCRNDSTQNSRTNSGAVSFSSGNLRLMRNLWTLPCHPVMADSPLGLVEDDELPEDATARTKSKCQTHVNMLKAYDWTTAIVCDIMVLT